MITQQPPVFSSLITNLIQYLEAQADKSTKFTKNEAIVVDLVNVKGAILSCEAKEALREMHAKSVQYCLDRMVEKNIIKRRAIDITKISHKSKSIYFIDSEHADRLEKELEKKYSRRSRFSEYR